MAACAGRHAAAPASVGAPCGEQKSQVEGLRREAAHKLGCAAGRRLLAVRWGLSGRGGAVGGVPGRAAAACVIGALADLVGAAAALVAVVVVAAAAASWLRALPPRCRRARAPAAAAVPAVPQHRALPCGGPPQGQEVQRGGTLPRRDAGRRRRLRMLRASRGGGGRVCAQRGLGGGGRELRLGRRLRRCRRPGRAQRPVSALALGRRRRRGRQERPISVPLLDPCGSSALPALRIEIGWREIEPGRSMWLVQG
jgi:hypothetical protein